MRRRRVKIGVASSFRLHYRFNVICNKDIYLNEYEGAAENSSFLFMARSEIFSIFAV